MMRHARFAARLLTLLVIATAGSGANAAVIFVKSDSSGANSGASWADAFVDLQDALAAAQVGDEIWVAAGTYNPGPPGDAVSTFTLRNGVALYGGFAGTESSREQRDWDVNASVLDGDVGHDDVIPPGWPNGWNITTANSAQIVMASGTDATAILDGFVLANGSTGPSGTPAGDPFMYGGGIYLVGGSPTIRHCTFRHNLAAFGHGGAIYCHNGSPIIEGCRFEQNYVHMGSGAGIYLSGASAVTISDCDFSGNIAITGSGGGEGQGGGIGSFSTQPLTVERCTFEWNTARNFSSAGGVEIGRGAGISSFYDGLTVRDCTFRNNLAEGGAGIFTWGNTTIVNCLFFDNRVYEHAFGGGGDGGYGAGVAGESFQSKTTTMLNCTIANNTGKEGVGFLALWNHTCVMRNSIVWGNTYTGQDVWGHDGQFQGTHSIHYSCVQDLLTPVPGEDPPDPTKYPGYVITDPHFVNTAARDFHLAPDSPCVDAGRNSDVLPGMTGDLDGLPRLADDCLVGNTGLGNPPVDMGVFERQGAPLVTQQPASLARDVGQTAVFAAAAVGSGPLTYQWRKDGTNLTDGGSISGATTLQLTIAPVALADAGSYDVVITGPCGSTSSDPATLTVASSCEPCDANCDGSINGFDVEDFVAALSGSGSGCSPCQGDVNGDGSVNGFDIDGFVTCLTGP